MSDTSGEVPVVSKQGTGVQSTVKEPACSNCNGLGYTDAWTLDMEYNPTHCEECDGGRKPPTGEPVSSAS